MKKSKVISAVAVCAVAVAVVSFVVLDAVKSGREYTHTSVLMNTTVSARVEGKGAKDVGEEIFESIAALENKLLSRHVELSAVSEVNDCAGSETVITLFSQSDADGIVSDPASDFLNILSRCRTLGEDSGGAFNPLLGRLSDLWGFGTGHERVPSDGEISAALVGTDEPIEINGKKVKIPQNTVLDLGAVGKGVACDEARKLLAKSKVKSAVVSVGGSILLYGEGERFSVGIRDPFSQSGTDCFATLSLTACCVSTSGSYERYFESDGVTYHHILNPKTGKPADSGLVSVTVVCEDGFLSDALSTACFVLGHEASLPLLEKYNAEAVFVTPEKKVIVTDGLRDSLGLEKDDFTVVDRQGK